MQVLVMRHGIAVERDEWPGDDALRPLTQTGEKKTLLAARGLARLCPRIDLIASSPLVRARQTADIAREVLKIEREVQEWPELALLVEEAANLEPVIERVRACGEACVLLVGHEPGCSRLLSLLMCSDTGALDLKWKKAGVASVEFENGSLEWFASPQILRELAKSSGR